MLLLKKNLVLRRPSAYTVWKIISMILIGLMIGSVIVSSYFIYSHVYRTLSDANTIIILNSSTLIDDVNLTGFEKAKQNVENKMPTTTISKNLRSIFVFVSTTPQTNVIVNSSTASVSP